MCKQVRTSASKKCKFKFLKLFEIAGEASMAIHKVQRVQNDDDAVEQTS